MTRFLNQCLSRFLSPARIGLAFGLGLVLANQVLGQEPTPPSENPVPTQKNASFVIQEPAVDGEYAAGTTPAQSGSRVASQQSATAPPTTLQSAGHIRPAHPQQNANSPAVQKVETSHLPMNRQATVAQANAAQPKTSQQTHTQQHTAQNQPASKQVTYLAPVDNNLQKVGFRLTEWKTVHAESVEAANESVETLKKIGCEVETNNHGNHIDVRYRCTDWKAMQLPSTELANQWRTWLKTKGMETVIVNPPLETQGATVKFRLVSAKHVHLHDPKQAKEIVGTLKMIGAEVTESQHGDHIDATFHCPKWTTIELASDQAAHVWQEWLKASGFETQHSH